MLLDYQERERLKKIERFTASLFYFLLTVFFYRLFFVAKC